MLRTLFFVFGLFALLQGFVCLAVDSMTLNEVAAERFAAWVDEHRRMTLPVWFGPSLVMTGGVTLLYALALPSKKSRRREHA